MWVRVNVIDGGVGWIAGIAILHCLVKPSRSAGLGEVYIRLLRKAFRVLYVN